MSTRVLNLLGQIALAWLLLPEDFGLISLAYTVTAFASVFQQLGLHFVLIQRQAHFRRWGNAGFWMSLTAGLASSVLILVAAPFAVWSYGNPQLWGLLLLLAMGPIIEGFGLVPSAWAQ
ncbi:MAG TPA: oligosaccharide flippase family protein, partial [Phycisphaeraceae bacterium]